ncbi:replication initiation protein (plasmid) [Escherichia coli]|uniref:replication initiation protein n=1 Tax=Escherichia coli TaxID=562 RepID=UPI00211679C6|nr:replication initiation protein [Escherichia coli]UUI23750.1 replication initiation protein [Escherichia coli]WOY66269.1 replication initiation protein [Escherichia coli]
MDKLLNKKIKVKQSNELTEAAYYLSLKAKRVLWLCLMQTYFTASVSEDDDEMAVLGDSTFKVKVADYEQIFQVSRNQAIKDVKEGVFELSRSAVIFYPKEGSFDCVARPWLTEAGSRSARGIWEIEFNHKRHCCKVSDEAAFCLIQRPYISKTLLTRRISPRGSP